MLDDENHKIIECNECEYTAIDPVILKNHKALHHGSSTFHCSECEFEATSKAILHGHMDTKHNKAEVRPIMCVYCDQVFSRRFLLEQHVCYLCEHCHHVEKTKANLQSHIQTMHTAAKVYLEQISYLSCDFCDYTCKLNIQLKRHIKLNHSEIKCYQCEEVFHDTPILKNHVELLHRAPSKLDFPCQFCGLLLSNYESLRKHIEIHHESEKVVDCQYSDKKVI